MAVMKGIGRRTKTDPAFDAARVRIYAQVRGQWNPETLRFVIDTYRNAADVVASRSYSTEPNQPGTYTGYIFGDYNLFGELYDDMEYMYHYGETMRQTVEKAQENAAFYGEKHNAFAVRESRAILRLSRGGSPQGEAAFGAAALFAAADCLYRAEGSNPF